MYKKRSSEDFDINNSGDDATNLTFSPPQSQRQYSAESLPSNNKLVESLFNATKIEPGNPQRINFYTSVMLSFYFLRLLICFNDEKCWYDPLDDLPLLIMANLDISWSHDFNQVIDYLAEPLYIRQNYNRKIRSSVLAIMLRICSSYQLQQYLGDALVDAKISALMAQIIACCVLEAYSKTFVAINTKYRNIKEPQPISAPVLFRQFTGQHDNSDDEYDVSNPNTPAVSPAPTLTPPRFG